MTKKIRPALTLIMASALTPAFAHAQAGVFKGWADDAGLSVRAAGPRAKSEGPLHPDMGKHTLTPVKNLRVQIVRKIHDRDTPVIGLKFEQGGRTQTTDGEGWLTLEACTGAEAVWKARLETPYFSIGDGGRPYEVEFRTPCQSEDQEIFFSDSPAGQAIGIWQVAMRAQNRLKSAVGLDFWKSSIEFVFPADADYYSFGQVHISRGDQWDVVGHEMGHAIYDLGDLGQFGGGEHKIDECYSTQMALSEGWASYFSAWISIPLDDADAKFEYMVPRRAPLRIEAIPSDVCRGERNEWRVTGFFWDLVDLHDDGEKTWRLFGETWKALLGSRVSSASEARHALERAGFDDAILQTIWDLNF